MFNALRTVSAKRIAGFFVFATLGVLAVSQPFVACGLLVAFIALSGLALFLLSLSPLRLWQVLVLVALSGYIVLNYGFANVTFHIGGLPIILGHALMFAALAIVVLSGRISIMRELFEPAVLTSFALILFSFVHLLADVPRFGFMAVRDSSIFLEAPFLFLGVAWVRSGNISTLFRWLFALFVINLLYGLTLPWVTSLYSWSPTSGIFHEVPVFGYYDQTYLYLLGGALFCLWYAKYIVAWPRWSLYLLAIVQMLALAIHQLRSTYLGIALILILLLGLRQFRKVAQLSVVLGVGLGALVLAGAITTYELPGRMGPVSLRFLEQHARSLLFESGTPEVGSLEVRRVWAKEIWDRVQSSDTTFLVGEGFGKPLINYIEDDRHPGIPVRQPSNTHLSVLARLGFVGIGLWTLFHVLVISRFLRTLLLGPALDPRMHALILWLFFYYVLTLLVTSTQALMEFSSGAIPFYFILGVALAMMRGRASASKINSGGRVAPATLSGFGGAF